MLATAAFVALPLPSGCDVPTGALNSTGVMSKRNELLLRSRATVSLAALDGFGLLVPFKRAAPRAAQAQRYLLTYPEVAAAARGLRLTYLPPARDTAPA